MITLALSKGRIFDETLPLLQAAGIEVLENPDTSRKLILPTNQADVRVVLSLNGALILVLGLLPGGLMALCAQAIVKSLGA